MFVAVLKEETEKAGFGYEADELIIGSAVTNTPE
jgi:hypothetical protein